MWLKKLKTALVLEEIERISILIDEMPQFQNFEEMEEALYLLAQSKTLLEQHKNQTAHTLQQLKNSLNFLKSTQTQASSSLNVKF